MAENKTKATDASVAAHLAAITNEAQRADCQTLLDLMGRITQAEPKMWGPTIVGFGSYHYKYASGREGDSPLAAFAARGREVVVYVDVESEEQARLLAQLGKHRMGKVCLYIRRLSDVNMDVLEKLVEGSIAEVRRQYG